MNMFLRNTLLGAVVSMLVSGASLAEERTVRIYNWIEYLPPEILKSFEEETGIRPIYDVFDSVETLESKLLTGNSGYDVVYPSSSNVSHLIAAGAVQPLDRSQLPNWQHLDPEFMKSLEAVGDPGNRYAAPYLWGTTLIGYNVDKVRQVLGADVQMNTWDILFKEENMAKLASCGVGLLDAANEIVPIALHYEGLDPNSQKREDYAKAQAAMLKVRPYITYFNSSRYGMDLANGEICVGVGWSGGVALAKRLAEDAGKGVKVEMALPKEGAPMWSDVMMVPTNALMPRRPTRSSTTSCVRMSLRESATRSVTPTRTRRPRRWSMPTFAITPPCMCRMRRARLCLPWSRCQPPWSGSAPAPGLASRLIADQRDPALRRRVRIGG